MTNETPKAIVFEDMACAPSFEEHVAALCKPGSDIQRELSAQDCHVLHMCLGLAGEAGELVDAAKKAIIYRKPIDLENLTEEIGDVFFYLEGILQAFNITRQQAIDANIAKLSLRYAAGTYSNKAAITRADKAEGAT